MKRGCKGHDICWKLVKALVLAMTDADDFSYIKRIRWPLSAEECALWAG